MDTQPIDVTSILAQPREFARLFENVLAQLEQAKSELTNAKIVVDAAMKMRDADAGDLSAMFDVLAAVDAYRAATSGRRLTE